MAARTVWLVPTIALFIACGTSRTANEGELASTACDVHVVNQTPYSLTLRQSLSGVRGSIRIGSVERDDVLRFSTRCDLGTVRIMGYRSADQEQDYAAYGHARLTEGGVTRVELRRASRYAESPEGDGIGSR